MITFTQKGDLSKTSKFLRSLQGLQLSSLDTYGQQGVTALANNTPVDSGLTADSWSYKIIRAKGKTTISWFNSSKVDGVPIAVILQYGHATKNGGWIAGRDYINPAIRPIFDKIVDSAWKEVTKL